MTAWGLRLGCAGGATARDAASSLHMNARTFIGTRDRRILLAHVLDSVELFLHEPLLHAGVCLTLAVLRASRTFR